MTDAPSARLCELLDALRQSAFFNKDSICDFQLRVTDIRKTSGPEEKTKMMVSFDEVQMDPQSPRIWNTIGRG